MFKPTTYNTAKTSRKTEVDEITDLVNYIRKRWTVRYNIFDNTYSVIQKNNKVEISKKDLRLFLKSAGFKININDFNDILVSTNEKFKVSVPYNPIREFFTSLEGKFKGISHIDRYASYIKPRFYSQEVFNKYFKKWFVAMVATAMALTKNDVMFVIVQAEGGTGKTYYIQNIVTLSQIAFFKKTISKTSVNLDLLLEATKNLLILLDELSALKPNYINEFKSDISQLEDKIRHRYQSEEVILPRLGSFAGTSNYPKEKGGFIPANDNGLMRRMFVVENTGFIDFKSYLEKVDFEQMYAEALSLIKSGNYDYNFNNEDYAFFINNNRRYLKKLEISELISDHFTKPINGEGEYLQPMEVKQILVDYNYPETLISSETIGRVLFNEEYTRTEKRINKIPKQVYYLKRK